MPGSFVPVWRFLGDVLIAGPDGDLTPRLGKKPLGLLAYLALAREGVRRDEIAALLWPDPDPARSRHNLRQCLLTLRRTFGDWHDAVLEVSDDWVALRHEVVDSDVRRLAEIDARGEVAADELPDLCRGPFLRGLTTRARPFDDWASAQRDRLIGAAARTLGTARRAAERAGRGQEAMRLTAALAALGTDPGAGTMNALAPRPEPPPARPARAPKRRAWLRAVALVLAGAALAAVSLLAVNSACEPCRKWIDWTVGHESDKPRIAVRPFTTAHGNQGEMGLAGGVTLGVTYALYAISDLFVVTPPPEAEQLEQMERIALARELGVRYLISGSVELAGDAVRVNVQCLDAEAGIDIWQDRFDQPYAEAFKLQDDIAKKIVSGLGIQLSTAEWNRIQYLDDTDNLLAWLYAANGVRHLIRVTEEDVELARDAYQKALLQDPQYISARRGLAWIAFLSVRLGRASNPDAAIAYAENELGVILGKRPDDGTSLSLKGAIRLLKRDYDEAIEAGRLATEKLPGSADAWAIFAHTLTYVGQHDAALKNIAKAMELSAIHPAWYRWTRGRALRMAGRFDESIAVLEQDRNGGHPTIVQMAELAATYAAAGRMGEARSLAAKIRAAKPDFTATEWLSHPPIQVPEIQSKEFEYLSSAGL